jgi:hypothetical protein
LGWGLSACRRFVGRSRGFVGRCRTGVVASRRSAISRTGAVVAVARGSLALGLRWGSPSILGTTCGAVAVGGGRSGLALGRRVTRVSGGVGWRRVVRTLGRGSLVQCLFLGHRGVLHA